MALQLGIVESQTLVYFNQNLIRGGKTPSDTVDQRETAPGLELVFWFSVPEVGVT